MNIRLHANATTTPKPWVYIQASYEGTQELAHKLAMSVSTVRHWRGRDDVHDRSHTRKNLLASLSKAQEAIVVELRRTLRLPLGELLALTSELSTPSSVARRWIAVCVTTESLDWPISSPARQ